MRNILVLVVSLLLGVCARAEVLTVSAAISLKESLTQIGQMYEAAGGDHVQFNFGASGTLEAQIAGGAPVDAFISAANKQVDDLVKAGKADAGSRRVIVRNEIVLIVPKDSPNPPSGFLDLADAKVKRLALGQPKSVPAGQYAAQTLATLKLTQATVDKTIYGANVRQVLDYVERGEVDAGIVYLTDAKEAGQKVKIVATADPTSHEPIEYPAVVIKESAHGVEAAKFIDFLSTPKAQAVLLSNGFVLPNPVTQPAQ